MDDKNAELAHTLLTKGIHFTGTLSTNKKVSPKEITSKIYDKY